MLRVQKFLDEHERVLGTINPSTSRTTLDFAVGTLCQAATDQNAAELEMTARTTLKNAARDDLRLNHWQPVAAIAKKKCARRLPICFAVGHSCFPREDVAHRSLCPSTLHSPRERARRLPTRQLKVEAAPNMLAAVAGFSAAAKVYVR